MGIFRSLLGRSLLFCYVLIPAVAFGLHSQRFSGVLRHEALQRDQLAKMDLISSINSDGKEELMAVLTVQFGDYRSAEFVSYHFDNILYKADTGWMVLDQTTQESGVSIPHFTPQGFEGRFRSNFSDVPARLILRADGNVPLVYPLLQPITGEYSGTCKGTPTVLQLNTYRSIEDTTKVGHPFADYEIHGEWGEVDNDVCYGMLCVKNTIFSGAYNFLRSHLQLNGRQGGIDCQVTDSGLLCDGCALKRTSKETSLEKNLAPIMTLPVPELFPPVIPQATPLRSDEVEGFYAGYLHHDLLDEYQFATLDLMTLPPADGKEGFQVSPLVRMYFGDVTSEEALSFRYAPITIAKGTHSFILKRPQDDIDAIVEVTDIGNGVLRGIWYSLLFGRVGTFEMFKSGARPLLAGLKGMGPIHGSYESQTAIINLNVSAVKTPTNTENPYFPLSFSGFFMNKMGLWTHEGLQGGSFDFFSGRIAINMTQEDRYWVGRRLDSNSLQLIHNTAGYMRLMGSHEGEIFHRVQRTSASPPPLDPLPGYK